MNSPKIFNHIQTLRGFSVFIVFLYHTNIEIFSSGYLGVDIFFVISGYLITTILINDIENKRLSILNFYERRARRILPALFFIVATLFFDTLIEISILLLATLFLFKLDTPYNLE